MYLDMVTIMVRNAATIVVPTCSFTNALLSHGHDDIDLYFFLTVVFCGIYTPLVFFTTLTFIGCIS